MTRTVRLILLCVAVAAVAVAAALPSVADASSKQGNGRPLTIYFTRHAEKQTTLVDTDSVVGGAPFYTTDGLGMFISEGGFNPDGERLDEACGTSNCAEELNSFGEERAELLAEWFARRGITGRVDAVYATHKTRTQQTVQPIADDAGLNVETFPKFGSDGTTPASELDPEGTTASECPTIEVIGAAREAGLDTVVVAGHSGTLYDIMGDGNDACPGLGLDTSDDRRFPKAEDGKVRDFGDVWKVVIRPNGSVRFGYRVQLQPTRLEVVNRTN